MERQKTAADYVYMLGITALVLFAILLVVHYTIRPIFRFKFGDKGFIPIWQTNDGQIVWTRAPAPPRAVAGFQRLIPCGFTLAQDIFVRPSTSVGKASRVFSYRATAPVTVNMRATSEDLITQYTTTNLLMYLASDTNDLTVSVITGTNDVYRIESAPTILNVPVGKPFRVTVILLDNLLEVYLNGRLFGTKVLKEKAKYVSNDFYGPSDGVRDTVLIMNLQYWNRVLSAKEIMDAPPALADAKYFGPAFSASCPPTDESIIDTIGNTVGTTLDQVTNSVSNLLG